MSLLRRFFNRVLRCKTSLALVLAAAMLAAMTGCEDPVIWSAASASSDGKWIAAARTIQHSGPGTNGVETIVDLKQRFGLRWKTKVLTFMDDGASMVLQLHWIGPRSLEVVFKGDPQLLYYQVEEVSGVEITVRNLPAAASGR